MSDPQATRGQSPAPGPNRPPLIRLASAGSDTFIVTPPPRETGPPAFKPFPFPRLPLSLHCWLAGLGAEFLGRHNRCLAALLVLDCVERRWLRPVVPAQACGSDGACWTLDLGDDGPLAGGCRIGGSFQVRSAADAMDAAASVPPLEGLHIVQAAQAARDGQAVVYYFLRASDDDGTVLVRAEDATLDDWDQALSEAADRMTFET